MNWSKMIRQIIAVMVASPIPVGLTAAFADSVGWSDALGLGLFFVAIAVLIVTMIHCYRFESFHSNAPM